MNRIALAFLLFLFVATAATLTSSRSADLPVLPKAVGPSIPVVVELFTSEGCSSCPAADEVLRELEATQLVAGVEVLALGQHVDYWNRLGWKDAFSSHAFTQRQRDYAAGFGSGSYTPQAVVNGQYEFAGGRRQEMMAALLKAAKAPHATVSVRRAGAGTLTVRVADLPAGTQPAEVLLALTETGLSSQVGKGENAGRLLRHASVVRALRVLGAVDSKDSFTVSTPLNLNNQWKTRNVRAVVLVQEKESRHIVGAGSLSLQGADLTSHD